ncbi:hypothetical protein [Arthrobacter sp. AL12]|uniref:hypothetical protein n=1 Tax=Arthrobacter sp. AL12 TaxID=3042241 RepID=UPI00249BBB93|nr:hypothetical protein [Arthrobacter sp. AL12]MDI3211062.1 hypothetical protein [Arthrobacter sp. AL12]
MAQRAALRAELATAVAMPLAEETGDREAIGRWVLGTASRQAASWRAAMSHCGDLWVSINLSSLQLPSPRTWRRLKPS